MTTILDDIVAHKRAEVTTARKARPQAELEAAVAGCPPTRDFARAVTAGAAAGPNIIAELKRKSPSAGVIVPDFDPVAIARVYEQHGAAALSLLTDETFFGGRLEYLGLVKKTVALPVLRKEFILGEYQVFESRAAGADAVLLIAEVLGAARCAELADLCRRLGLTPLIEVHAQGQLDELLAAAGPPAPERYLLGINNRDLAVQRTDLQTTARLAASLPQGTSFISESGISTRADVLEVQRAGASAVLIGESLLKSQDIGRKLDELRGH